MAKNWVQVEEDPNIIDADVDEAIKILENVTFFTMPWFIIKMGRDK